ncbi:MAG: adenosylcobinamide-GDP ribazoletransferase [Rhizobiaceae bacterium]
MKETAAGLVKILPGQFAQAIIFFTRIALPEQFSRLADHRSGLDRAAPVFPLAGLAIGLVAGSLYWCASLFLPSTLAAALALAASLLLTGALHEDGLADCADGLGGGHSRDRALDIMRDSRIGVYGACALVLSLIMRWSALAALTAGGGFLALLIAHSASRGAIAIALAVSTYARREGAGSLVSSGINSTELGATLAVSLVIALLAGGFAGICAVGAGWLAAWLFLRYFEHRIGGYTGDCLGAMQQACEITALALFAGFWSGAL